ncbi:dihydrolipoamide dehydrogenase [Pseudochelatococcus lubricantis]|uniref:Dihydrolipoyl dehydrogenase n=1 Tax=Pseudochelatococcus lubricantis TaxID=1538102 RepID=A0ABX0UVU9_9HYPH|nr:dihydrolipoyl dehydrogenase [Pseudochelatococcus lubricantis]NIJ57071.1 dihydrolipoamide dehydrogenase [Pseudochelatococcus lubricantis]
MPNPATGKDITCRLLVIGAGPGGYVTAIRAGQLGVDTVIVEGRKVGGTCLTIGCIPSKALIHAAEEFDRVAQLAAGNNPFGIAAELPTIDLARTIQWKDEIVSRLNSGVAALLKKARVKIVTGRARFVDGRTVAVETDVGTQIVRAETVVIATGSAPVELPFLPFGGDVISSTEALSLTRVPDRLAIIGGGYIGLELGTAFAKLGSRVTVVEAAERILPQYDAELTQPVSRRLKRLDVTVLTGTKARGRDGSGKLLVEGADGTTTKIAADRILVTVGRRPVTEGWGREELALDMDGRFLRVDAKCETSMRGIYAIGDVTGEPMLAHRAMAQGEMVAEIVAGHRRQWDRQAIPAICFTDPEIVSVGMSPDEARAAGRESKVGVFPFTANGRALTKHAEDGFVRVVARADNHVVLGIQAVGQGISEMAAAFGLALEMGARLEDIAGTIHAHPTQGEALQEAALRTLGRAIHM